MSSVSAENSSIIVLNKRERTRQLNSNYNPSQRALGMLRELFFYYIYSHVFLYDVEMTHSILWCGFDPNTFLGGNVYKGN